MTFQQFLRDLAGITESNNKLDQLLKTTGDLLKMATKLATEIDALKASVITLTTAEQSAIALIGGFSAQLTAAVDTALEKGATPAELTSLTDLQIAIDTNTAALAAAVAANTPTPAPPTPPSGPPVQTSAPTA